MNKIVKAVDGILAGKVADSIGGYEYRGNRLIFL